MRLHEISRRATGIAEDNLPSAAEKYVFRIDGKKIPNFQKKLRTYYHNKDYSMSGADDWEGSTGKMQGVYAGTRLFTAPYTTGSASGTGSTRYVAKYSPGQPIIYFDKKDIPRLRNKRSWLTVFDGSKFKKLPSGEYFSSNPGAPLKQIEITDPFQWMRDSGWEFKIVDDLPAVLKQLQKAKVRYGAEGMPMQENELDEIARIPKSELGGWGDEGTIEPLKSKVKKKPLPGGSGYTYAVNKTGKGDLEIMIFDGEEIAAELDLFETQDVLGTWGVETVVVRKQYRGQGLGKALYGIALSILKLTLEAGGVQTAHGQRMWLMLNSIPGVKVKGYNMVPTEKYQAHKGDKIVKQDDQWTRYTFPVHPGKRSMRSGRPGTGLYTTQATMVAKWTGEQHDVEEGLKSKLAGAALAGGMALGAGGANAMDWKDAAMTGAMFVPGIGQAVKAYNVGKNLYQAGTAAKQYRDAGKELDALAAQQKAQPKQTSTVTYDPNNADKFDPVDENFADKKVKGKSRPGRVKRAGASCSGSVTDLRAKAKKYGGEKGKMYHWCANMKSGKKK